MSHILPFHEVVYLLKISTLFLRRQFAANLHLPQIVFVFKRLLFFFKYLRHTAAFEVGKIFMGLLHVLVSHFMDLRYTCWSVHGSFVFVLFIFFERHIRQIVIADVLGILLFFGQFLFDLLHFLNMFFLGFFLLFEYLLEYSGILIFFHISSAQLA